MNRTTKGFGLRASVVVSCALWSVVAWAAPPPLHLPSIPVPSLYIEEIVLGPGASAVAETSAPAGVDEVLHVMLDSGGAMGQVAWNDGVTGIPGVTAQVSWTNTTGATARYLLVVRARYKWSAGTASLKVNGASRGTIPVDGLMMPAKLLGPAPGGHVEAVPEPGGSEWAVLMPLSDFMATQAEDLAMDNGAAGATRVTWKASTVWYLLGSPVYRDATGVVTVAREGNISLYANEGLDTDGDGVGDALEAELGLCRDPALTAPECDAATTAIDTDRDGLPDGEELFGLVGANSAEDVAFPRWGAIPDQKDAFLVLAWDTHLDAATGSTPMSVHPFDPWTHPDAMNLAPSFADWVDDIREPFLLGPAHHLQNPNGQDGLRVHLDAGVLPNDPTLEDRYGVLSDQIQHALTRRVTVTVSQPVTSIVTVTVNGQPKSFDGSGMTTTLLAYALIGAVWDASGGQVDVYAVDWSDPSAITVEFEVVTPGLQLHLGVAMSNSPADDVAVSVRYQDDADLRRRGYVGSELVLPLELERRTRFGAVTPSGGQAFPAKGAFFSRFGTRTLVHEFGHTFGISHDGSTQWLQAEAWLTSGTPPDFPVPARNISRNCMPHYVSLMNYAYEGGEAGGSFSDVEVLALPRFDGHLSCGVMRGIA